MGLRCDPRHRDGSIGSSSKPSRRYQTAPTGTPNRLVSVTHFYFYCSAILLGVVAGMRSMMPLAVLAITLSRRPELAPAVSPVHWFSLRAVAVVLGLAAIAEIVTDKLPRTPNRTALGPFVVRVASGAVTGAALVQIGHIDAWIGAGCGAIGAILGTFGAFHARRFAGRVTGIRDPYIGALEDVIAIALAAAVVAGLVG
jgi:uncharacterized membrane protein